VPSLSQLKVTGPFALVGFQLLVDMLNVNDVPEPVFLTYSVLVTVLPGVMVPQSMVDRLFVHALSEYILRFGVTVIEPLEDKVLRTLSAPYVVSVKTKAIRNKAVINIEIFVCGSFSFNSFGFNIIP
jgi:hypothetical protein